jgi:hypothetical protein
MNNLNNIIGVGMKNMNKKEYRKPEVSELNSALTESGKAKTGDKEKTEIIKGVPSTMGPS